MQIGQLDKAISDKRNLIEHDLNARLTEAQGTLDATEAKILEVQTACQLLQDKLKKSEKLVDELLAQKSSLQQEKEKAQAIASIKADIV